MKTALFIHATFIVFALRVAAQSPAPSIANVDELSGIKVQTSDRGIVTAGDVRDVLANYPTLATSLKAAIKARMDAADVPGAARIWKELQSRGVTFSATVTNAINSRIDAFRQQKESALQNLLTNNPAPGPSPSPGADQATVDLWNAASTNRQAAIARSKAKMDEFISAGIPISQGTQATVNAAQPTPAPNLTPAPTPNDGL